MKLSKDAVAKEIRSLEHADELVFVGTTQAQANALAEKSLNKRHADAAAEYAKSGWPTPIKPRNTIADLTVAAHERLRKQNEENQKRNS